MGISIGRERWLGIGVEDTPGSAVIAKKYLPFLTCSLRPVHEPLVDETARGMRDRVAGSVEGPKRGEGDVEIILDVTNAPFLLVPGMGAVTSTNTTASIYKHTITRKAGNAPKSVTLIHSNSYDTRKYVYATVDSFEINVSDGLATMTASFLSKYPSSGTGSKSITAETVLSFKDYNLYFDTTYSTLKAAVAAGTATATEITSFSLRYNNNSEIQHVSGSNDVDTVSYGQLEIDGDYTLFFEDATERDKYENLTKKAMIIQFLGGSLASGDDTEEILIGLPSVHLSDRTLDTAIAGFITESPSFVAEYDATETKTIEIEVTNEHDGSDY